MDEVPERQRPRNGYLVDCPYCEGDGTDANEKSGLCARCHGTGRMTWFLAARIRARWEARKASGSRSIRPVEDAVPDYYGRGAGAGRGLEDEPPERIA